MGAWDVQPWDNDGAADWFATFFEGISADEKIDEAFQHPDDHEAIRAACYLLDVLGISYVWPGDLGRLDEHLETGIQLLTRMLDPEDPDMEFLELWEDDPDAIASVRAQIEALQRRRRR